MANIYLKYGDVKGSSTETKYKEWIQVQSLSFGANRLVNMGRGKATDRASGDVNFQEISLSFEQDNGTIGLYSDMLGTKANKATIALVTDVKGKATQYLSIELTDALVSSLNLSTSSERPQVSISLSYIAIEVDVSPIDAVGTIGDAVKVIYNIGTGELS